MKKVEEFMIEIDDDSQAILLLQKAFEKYPANEGYRVEMFKSDCLIRITIYKVNKL